MNVLDMILNEPGAIDKVANELGISQTEAKSGLSQLVPALARGVTRNAEDEKGMGTLLKALETGNHGRYLDNPDILSAPETTQDGNGILGHIFGNKDVSREVAKKASASSGIAAGLLRKMLPMAASLVMGALSRRMLGGGGGGGGGILGGLLGGGSSQPQLGGLAGLLDFDRDGSVVDDILGMVAKRFF